MLHVCLSQTNQITLTCAERLCIPVDKIECEDDNIVGETQCELTMDGQAFIFHALIVHKLHVNAIGGLTFLTQYDISIRPSKKEIIIHRLGSDAIYTYESYTVPQNSSDIIKHSNSSNSETWSSELSSENECESDQDDIGYLDSTDSTAKESLYYFDHDWLDNNLYAYGRETNDDLYEVTTHGDNEHLCGYVTVTAEKTSDRDNCVFVLDMNADAQKSCHSQWLYDHDTDEKCNSDSECDHDHITRNKSYSDSDSDFDTNERSNAFSQHVHGHGTEQKNDSHDGSFHHQSTEAMSSPIKGTFHDHDTDVLCITANQCVCNNSTEKSPHSINETLHHHSTAQRRDDENKRYLVIVKKRGMMVTMKVSLIMI